MKSAVFITPAPSFKEKEIKKIISSKFGISGSVKHLYGDRDQNFHVETHDRSYILKVFNTQAIFLTRCRHHQPEEECHLPNQGNKHNESLSPSLEE